MKKLTYERLIYSYFGKGNLVSLESDFIVKCLIIGYSEVCCGKLVKIDLDTYNGFSVRRGILTFECEEGGYKKPILIFDTGLIVTDLDRIGECEE